MNHKTLNYCCMDCGNLIDNRTALYGKGRCNLCYNEIRDTPPSQYKNLLRANKQRKGKKVPHTLSCKCPFCKAHRGEMKGINNSNFGNKWTEIQKQKLVKKLFQNNKRFKQNKQEKFIESILPRGFKFVGDGKTFIGGYVPDFINFKKKLIIEFFGTYWHKKRIKQDQLRINCYKRNGYKTLIIWDIELKNLTKLNNKIKMFGEII